MDRIEKLASEFEIMAQADMFGGVLWSEEAKKVAHLAGKLLYKASRNSDYRQAREMKRAGELLLAAADILKKI